MNEYMKNVIIGLFVIITSIIIVLTLMYLHPSVGDSGTTLYVRFPDIDKISIGTRVTFAGKHVGEVTNIDDVAESRKSPYYVDERIYPYELKLSIDSSVKIYDTDEIAIRTSGLLGEKSISIIPCAFKEKNASILMNNSVMYAKGVGSVEETIEELNSFTSKARTAMNQIVSLIDANSQELTIAIQGMRHSAIYMEEILGKASDSNLIESFKIATTNINIAMNEINNNLIVLKKNKFADKLSVLTGNLASITDAVNSPENINSIIKNIDKLSTNLNILNSRINASWDSVDTSVENIAIVTSEARKIIENIKYGKNNLGKLINNDDLYVHTLTSFSKIETILNDVNHYGLLFHLDKGWQRQRTKRMNMLQTLSTPDEFQYYFDEEISQISTSLSRVSEVLEKIKNMNGEDTKEQERLFTTIFSNMLNQIQSMEDSINIYNTQFSKINKN